MRKITFVFIFFLLTNFSFYAQAVSGYLFTQSTEVFTPVAGINSGADGDDGTDNNIPIGFSFNFGGVAYTSFSISVNGFIRLGTSLADDNYINLIATDAPQRPLIAAFWDDHNRAGGSISYNTTGISPNRTLEVGWTNINLNTGQDTNATDLGSLKIKLFENGNIEFVYGSSMVSPTGSASIGINDASTFMSITPGTVASPSNITANNNVSSTANLVGKKYIFTAQPQCLGTPDPGNTVASSNSACSDVAFVLSIQNQSNAFNLTYQWQSSPDGISFNNIGNSNANTLTVIQDLATYYQCIVTCNGSSAVSSPIMVGQNDPSDCFCIPNYDVGKTDGDLISNVVIAGTTLSNNTGTAPVNPSYTYFSGLPNYTAELQPGVSYNISVTVGSYQEQNVAVWIDYNDDIEFTPNERVGFTTAMIGSNGTGTFPITLSCDPPAGVHRMRVRDAWNTPGSTLLPCATYGYGETEDYDVMIVAGEACPAPYALATGIVNSTSAQLSWTSGCGQLLWNVHVTLAGGGIPSGESSNPSVNGSPLIVSGLLPSTSYEFYVMAQCSGDDESIWAGPFAFTTAAPAVPNDECEGTFALTPGLNFEEHAMTATNVGASKSLGYPNPTCAAFAFGGDVWFSIVVPETGNITIETKQANGSPLIDTGLNVFSGSCGALTVLGCNDEGGDGGFSLLSLTGLAPGSTIYARVWEYANDTLGPFRISAWSNTLATDSFDFDEFSFYPNPVKDVLQLSYSHNISEIRISNIIGQTVLTKINSSKSAQVDMSALPPGTYIVRVTSENLVRTVKVVKE
jgi:hypothetical protein